MAKVIPESLKSYKTKKNQIMGTQLRVPIFILPKRYSDQMTPQGIKTIKRIATKDHSAIRKMFLAFGFMFGT